MTQKCMKVVCDRCGATVHVKKFPVEVFDRAMDDDKRWNLSGYSKTNFDLCPKCAREYEKIMRGYWEWGVQP